MSAINDLISQIENPDLRMRIQQEVSKMAKQKKFGLVFEEHLPENTPLYELPIRSGIRVAKREGDIKDNYVVVSVDDEIATCEHLDDNHERASFPVADLIAVAQFGEPIYPYLKPIDSICNAPDSELWHTLIQADNYHALQLLVYLYGGKVDCIYIDPPYNTGARDWKYNNDYVDSNDQYRHSKWLSFMKKRLQLAKKLLNPCDSVLIVTIDEKEYLHLGCLLEEIFPEARMQMISSVTNHAGNGKKNDFCRTNEYLYFLMLGDCIVTPQDNSESRGETVLWDTLRRHNPSNIRTARPSQFYPIYINKQTRKIFEIGAPITPDIDRFSVPSIEGCETVFPVKDNGVEMMWGLLPEELRRRNNKGYVKIGQYDPTKPQQYKIQFLSSGTIDAIERNEIIVTGHRDDGSVIVVHPGGKKFLPKTQWDKAEHDARDFGTKILKSLIGSRFDFPKSLYAVADCLRYFVANKPNALIVDFFAGSGTTLHAVNLLNKEDGGNRRCIMVTNNEVSDDEAKVLKKKGFKPGDKEWESLGIAQYVTWPRTICSIQGKDIKGEPLKGNYQGKNIPMSEGFHANANFFRLGFLDKTNVALGRQFKELLPLLWMKAGAKGECPSLVNDELPNMLICENNHFAVLIDEKVFAQFVEQVNELDNVQMVYLVVDSDSMYREMARSFPKRQTCQLYRDYLDNFRINVTR